MISDPAWEFGREEMEAPCGFCLRGCAELWCMFRSSPEKLREYRGRFLESFVFGQPFQVDEG